MSDPIGEVVIAPMSRAFLLWRSLHDGPLDLDTIDAPTHPGIDWQALRLRNSALLGKLCGEYGSCAMLAWHDERVVGILRFYPRAICELDQAGQMCLQQISPNGPSPDLADIAWPAASEIPDRTLLVHCLMTGSPKQDRNPYQRRGLGARLVRELEAWARERNWLAIEATAYPNLDIVYKITGQAGLAFWQKLGYHIVDTSPVPELAAALEGTEPEQGIEGYLQILLEQAHSAGMTPKAAVQQYTLRKEL